MEDPVGEEPAGAETLKPLCGEDYQTYLTEAITMQMESRMEKDPEVAYFPIQLGQALTQYVSIGPFTEFTLDKDGNIVITFPAGAVTDEAHGEQSFIIPRP